MPRLDALERIVPKALVKPTEPDLAVPSDFVPLFHLLVPAAVIEMAARYAGARDAHVAALVNKGWWKLFACCSVCGEKGGVGTGVVGCCDARSIRQVADQ